MSLLISSIFFLLGIVVGSFLNVVICRFNSTRSFLKGRSCCMSCNKNLSWYELIPLLSFVFLHGRCNSCQTRISSQYPIIELITGIIFLVLFLKFEGMFYVSLPVFIVTYLYYAFIFSLLLVIAVYDFRHKIIPDLLAFVFGLFAFVGLFFFDADGLRMHIPGVWELLSGVIIALPFGFLWLVSLGRWMGLGDAKLALGIGWLLGLSQAASAVMIAFWLGAIIGVALIVSKKYGMKSEIPFAPYLILAMFLVFIFNLNFLNF